MFGLAEVQVWSIDCSSCPIGLYSEAIGATSVNQCMPCPAGYFSTITGLSAPVECQECGAGKHSATAGATSPDTCENCPAGTYSALEASISGSNCNVRDAPCHYSLPGSVTNDACVCPAGTIVGESLMPYDGCGQGGAGCNECYAGTVSESPASTVCVDCVSGKFSSVVGVASVLECQTCPVSTASSTGSSSSAACLCAAGTYSVDSGCIACGTGKYSTAIGAVSFEQRYGDPHMDDDNIRLSTDLVNSEFECKLYVLADTRCVGGMWRSTRIHTRETGCWIVSQTSMEDITWLNLTTTIWLRSVRGQAVAEGQGVCNSYVEGTHFDAMASTACTECPPGKTSQSGASALAACQCPGGMVLNTSTQECTPCFPGTYSTTGQGHCSQCTAGTYSQDASSSCTNCPAGTFSGSTAATSPLHCVECPAGTFSRQPRAVSLTECEPCAMGSYSEEMRAISEDICKLCPAATYGVSAGSDNVTQCLLCSKGKFPQEIHATSAATCANCLPGTLSVAEGSTACMLCPLGTFSWDSGLTSEDLCLVCCVKNQYRATIHACECTYCPQGSYMKYGSNHGTIGIQNCQVCAIGTYYPPIAWALEPTGPVTRVNRGDLACFFPTTTSLNLYVSCQPTPTSSSPPY